MTGRTDSRQRRMTGASSRTIMHRQILVSSVSTVCHCWTAGSARVAVSTHADSFVARFLLDAKDGCAVETHAQALDHGRSTIERHQATFADLRPSENLPVADEFERQPDPDRDASIAQQKYLEHVQLLVDANDGDAGTAQRGPVGPPAPSVGHCQYGGRK